MQWIEIPFQLIRKNDKIETKKQKFGGAYIGKVLEVHKDKIFLSIEDAIGFSKKEHKNNKYWIRPQVFPHFRVFSSVDEIHARLEAYRIEHGKGE